MLELSVIKVVDVAKVAAGSIDYVKRAYSSAVEMKVKQLSD